MSTLKEELFYTKEELARPLRFYEWYLQQGTTHYSIQRLNSQYQTRGFFAHLEADHLNRIYNIAVLYYGIKVLTYKFDGDDFTDFVRI